MILNGGLCTTANVASKAAAPCVAEPITRMCMNRYRTSAMPVKRRSTKLIKPVLLYM